MWYVIQTMAGKEHEVCMWINTFVDKSLYSRCFVPLYEDVWRKEGIGHISIKKLFAGYLFVETDSPKMSVILSSDTDEEKFFLPLHKEEEVFFDTILSDGIMKVSYIHLNHAGRINQVIGPLQSFLDNILRVDIPHRRAIVDVPLLGEVRRLKLDCGWILIRSLIGLRLKRRINTVMTPQMMHRKQRPRILGTGRRGRGAMKKDINCQKMMSLDIM